MGEQFHFHGARKIDPPDPSMLEFPHPRRPSRAARLFWPVFYGILLVILLLLFLVRVARAGGPAYVAGASYFDSTVNGTPLTWLGGTISFYTDPGDLSPQLPHSVADAFVADAFSRWTQVPTAALAATEAGVLAEDVNGNNVILNSDGTITMPADILPSAVTKPLAIVYDADGKVTDALLGSGAGSSSNCFVNAAFGGVDNYGTDAHFLHALVILNGNCAQTSAQIPDVKYRLVRVLGRVLGLGWSQVNVNVVTWKPTPTPEDLAGFPVMHAFDHTSCVPVTICYPSADIPKTDDQASISRLYPVTSQNIGNFSGKQLFAANTVRIHGSVKFVDSAGLPAQPMQGVNVVARWIDPSTSQPSRLYAAASVSGFLFHGTAGNPVNGDADDSGQPYNQFGSDDATWEGFYDLAGLPIPNAGSSAQYQLTVEAIDPLWSETVGPYQPWQVQPSGAAQPITVTVSLGGDVQQDILMQGSAAPPQDAFSPATYDAPAPVPSNGEWTGTLNGYGQSEFFRFTGQTNRTLSMEVTALDETGAASQTKALPVIGMWALADPPGTPPPAATPMAFLSSTFGMSQLNVNLLATTDFRIGIADFRGDGRPDYRYHARLFYGDNVTPTRASVRGTPLMIKGYGFRPGNTVRVGSVAASMMSAEGNFMMTVAPAGTDGVTDITLADPATGASSVMAGALTYGAGPTDTIRLISGSNPPIPVGGQTVNPIRVKVLAADGVTPISGASVQFSAAPLVAFDICSGGSTCTVLSDESGEIFAGVTVLSTGTTTITATLAPASYPNPKQVQTTIVGTSSALDVAAVQPARFLAQGSTLDLPLSVRVLSNGVPINGKTVKFTIVAGSGTLTATTPSTNSSGYASTTLHVTAISNAVQVSACAEPGDAPCQSFYLNVISTAQLQLEPVSGSVQVISSSQSFAPVIFRVTDSSSPANPIVGASVLIQSAVMRPDFDAPIENTGETIVTQPTTPVILSSWQGTVISDGNGLATYQASTGISGSAEVEGTASVGSSSLMFELESVQPVGNAYTSSAKRRAPGVGLLRPRTEE